MNKVGRCMIFSLIVLLLSFGSSYGAVITFDDLIQGQTSYLFDADNDAIMDVRFSTMDPLGFNTVGPGLNMTYIQEPGLEGTALLNPDLRVDFLTLAKDSLTFGFALDSFSENVNTWMSFSVYDTGGNLLASAFQYGFYTYPYGRSNYPEGQISVTFAGIASYALFNFNSDAGRYIIDNFQGTYGSTEVPTVPEPSTILLLGAGIIGAGALRLRKG